jgi:transposase
MTVTTQTPPTTRSGHVVIGVDTHKLIHVAAVLDPVGGILETLTIPIETAGYRRLLEWAASFGQRRRGAGVRICCDRPSPGFH